MNEGFILFSFFFFPFLFIYIYSLFLLFFFSTVSFVLQRFYLSDHLRPTLLVGLKYELPFCFHF